MNTDRFKAKALTVGENPKWVSGWYEYLDERTHDSHMIFRPKVSYHEINPDTLCQCTGLKDSNGDLIYEGDILDQQQPANLWLIEWLDSEWVLQAPDDPTIIESNVQDVVDMTLTGKNIHDINQ